MNNKLKLVLFLATFFQAYCNFAQQDTIFWFAAPEVSSGEGESPVYLNVMSYSDPAQVTVSQPANIGFTPIVVNLLANSSNSIDLTPFLADIESAGGDIIDDSGLKIESTEMVSVSYELATVGNKEVFSLKGNKGIGTDFYTPFPKNWNNAVTTPATFSSIEIIATEDNTTIAITPRANITGHVMNSTFTIVLQEGETYSARDTDVSAGSSLAGSIVSSNKPISVTIFSGAIINSGCNSTLGEQIVSTPYLGNNFIINKAQGSDERIYILGTQNSTSISIENSGTTSTLINWGETYEYVLTDDINYIETNKPVYLLHVGGNGCNLGMTQVPNVSCAGKYEQSFIRESADSLGLAIYVRAGYETMFTLNGSTTLINPLDFTIVPGTNNEYVTALIYFNTTEIPTGANNLLVNSGDIFGLGIINGEHGNGTGYSFVSEFQSYPFVNSGLDATVCANGSFPVNGIIGGGSVTGDWGSTGFGSWEKGLDTLVNIYYPSNLDTIISPIELILTTSGPCPVLKDTIFLTVTPAPLVNASADQIVCANNADVTLAGSVQGGATTGEWSTLGSGTFLPDDETLNAVYVPSDLDTAAGSVQLVLTSTFEGGCQTVRDTMQITITDAPAVDIVLDTIWVCENNPDFSLVGTVSGGTTTGKWITSGTGVFNPDNLSLTTGYEPSPQDVTNGPLTIYLESTNNGDCSKVIDSIKVIFTSSAAVDAGLNQLVCENDLEINLNGTVSGQTITGEWSGGAGTFTPDNATLSATYIPTTGEVTSGAIVLTLTSTNNLTCLAESEDVLIEFKAPPFANFNFNNTCLNDTTYFTDFSLDGFGTIDSWSYNFGDGEVSTDLNPYHIYDTPGLFDAELIVESNIGCSDTIVQSVQVFAKPVADFDYTSTCNNDQIIIDFIDESSVSDGTITNWFYDFGGQGNQALQNPSQLFLGEGNFTITQIVKSNNGCSDTVTQIINIPPRPTAGFFYNSSNGFNVGAEFNFIDTSSHAVTWYYDLDNGDFSDEQNPSTVYFSNGIYNVTQWVTSDLGCEDSITLKLEINTVTNEISDLIPNAISPNGDGKNDIWKLEFIELLHTNAEVIIVNRWGQTVYESIGYTDPWDGTFNDELVPEGTYYYVIKISESEIYKGTILVLKSGND